MLNTKQIRKLLKLAARYNIYSSLSWDEDLQFFKIRCDNVFFDCPDEDSELIENTIDINFLEFCLTETDTGITKDGPAYYCAFKKDLRPQGAYYKFIDEKNWALFDKCGPVRDISWGNPKPHPIDYGDVDHEYEEFFKQSSQKENQ